MKSIYPYMFKNVDDKLILHLPSKMPAVYRVLDSWNSRERKSGLFGLDHNNFLKETFSNEAYITQQIGG